MKPKKFSKNLIKDILKQKVFDVEIDLDDFDLIKHDNWILEQIRKRDDVFFRYVGYKYAQKRVMRIYTNE
tara:strand:+ start:594 stop:803 length:210 start_codon:yes stop_codon:yes gene_type:complete